MIAGDDTYDPLDDDVAVQLSQLARREGRSLSRTANEFIRAGMRASRRKKPGAYVPPTFDTGRPLSSLLAAGTRGSVRHHLVYIDTVGRTQVYLGTEEIELLDRAASQTGASRSELIRRAVRATFGENSGQGRLEGLRRSAGSWRRRSFSGSEYVDALRGDLNERLRRAGID